MPRPYSLDLRSRVIAACDDGESPEAVAEKFQVGVRTIYDWLELRQQTGGLAPRAGKPGQKLKLADHAERLKQMVRDKPDSTLEELKAKLPLKVGVGTLHNMLIRLGLTFKKEGHPRRRAATS